MMPKRQHSSSPAGNRAPFVAKAARHLAFRWGPVSACVLGALTVHAAPVEFDIPAQTAGEALTQFVRQSQAKVIFSQSDLAVVAVSGVKGRMEPREALEKLLADSGLALRDEGNGVFAVGLDPEAASTGIVRGEILLPDGTGAEGALVTVRGTGQTVVTDDRGAFVISKVSPGIHVLEATSKGYLPLFQTNVSIRAGHTLALGPQSLHPASDSTKAEPYTVVAEPVTVLGNMIVEERNIPDFSGGNLDKPRTINDVQPYVILDSRAIAASGATSLDEFLKQRLTMNATVQTNAKINDGVSSSAATQASRGTRSEINLLGLGADKTLILVDGRPMVGVSVTGTKYQTDLNGIPLSAIERIEVLPTSASAIYGPGAIGGVVNIILKRNYSGGELNFNYQNVWGVDAPTRTASLSYGIGLEGGRTQFMVAASWSDQRPMLILDRVDLYRRNLEKLKRNNPEFLFSTYTPWQGSVPNIRSYTNSNLVLDDGRDLGSIITFVSPGTAPTQSATSVADMLYGNAGKWNLDLPMSSRSPTGLLRQDGSVSDTHSLRFSGTRKMTDWLSFDAGVNFFVNSGSTISNPTGNIVLAGSSVANPFQDTIIIQVADDKRIPLTTKSESLNVVTGFNVNLPGRWNVRLDYSWSKSRYQYDYSTFDSSAMLTDAYYGLINPFVDTFKYQIPWDKYLVSNVFSGSSETHLFSLKGVGPLPSLPWGSPLLTTGVDHSISKTPAYTMIVDYPVSFEQSTRSDYFEQKGYSTQAFGELTLPLVKQGYLPFLQSVEAQVAGSYNRSETLGGATRRITYFRFDPPFSTIDGASDNGVPVRKWVTVSSANYTSGLKVDIIPGLTLRGSRSSAFLPPNPEQLVKNPTIDAWQSPVIDPKTNQEIYVNTVSGGNPNLKPQSSLSYNLGLVYEPQLAALKGLRFNLEYYVVDQNNAISGLYASQIVALEKFYPDRVKRDANGVITEVDTSLLNLFKRHSAGTNLTVSYVRDTHVGTFDFALTGTHVNSIATQYSAESPDYESVGIPSEGGAIEYKASLAVNWSYKSWQAGWTTTYYGSYGQYGKAGGPYSQQNYGGEAYTYYSEAGGRDTIPAQVFHDAFVSYTFGSGDNKAGGRLARLRERFTEGLSLSLGVNNVFGTEPEFDPYFGGLYTSPVADIRLRTYWLNVRKQF